MRDNQPKWHLWHLPQTRNWAWLAAAWAILALGALGVVYGDIGTSPLYAMKTALDWAGGRATPSVALGMLSLIVWTLLITTSIKYVAVVMRADNEGEGGILALMSLLAIKHGNRGGIIAIGVLGAALLYGDGAITPAISVLSALEGLKEPVPAIAPDIVPLSVIVLAGVFGLAAARQRTGSANCSARSWSSGSSPSAGSGSAASCGIQAS